MNTKSWRILAGVGLLLLGGILLLDNLNIFKIGELIWSLLFAAGSLAFFYVLVTRKESWWAVFPAAALLGIAAVIAMDRLPFLRGSDYGGAVFLGLLALSFWYLYLSDHKKWWAVIPAGVLTTLAGVIVLDNTNLIDTGAFFMLGLGLTFILLVFLPNGSEKMTWPWIPGLILLAIALIISLSSESLLNYLWPVVLILGGLWLVSKAFRKNA